MRKFLSTLLAASAIAAPAAATTLADEPGPDGPRDRTHVRQRDNDSDNSSEARARPSGGERSNSGDRSNGGDRPRFERPAMTGRPAAVEPSRMERQAVERAEHPDRGPPEWKGERSNRGDTDTVERPRNRDFPSGWGETSTGTVTPRTRDGWTPRPSDGGTNVPVVQHRDRPDGSFNRPSTTSPRHTDYRQWNRTWRDDRKYDWRHYRERNRSTFRLGFYYDPYGYQYRRWNIGWSMRPYYYRSTYWLNDPWRYRLPEVYGPYRWVRYYDDAILVNTWTGEVVDVIYNFFW